MPELPEVETIKRGLIKFIKHQNLQATDILCAKSFIGEPAQGIVEDIRRFGKALVIDLDTGQSLMIHLRMTGQLIYDSNDKTANHNSPVESGNRFAAGHPSDNFTASLPNKQTRVVLHFKNGTLYFNDQRKFGFIKTLAVLHQIVSQLESRQVDIFPKFAFDHAVANPHDSQPILVFACIFPSRQQPQCHCGILGQSILFDSAHSSFS